MSSLAANRITGGAKNRVAAEEEGYTPIGCRKAVCEQCVEHRQRMAQPALLTTSCFILVFCSLCLLASFHDAATYSETHSISEASQPQGGAQPWGSSFVIVVTSVRRPGDVKYISNAVMSLYCALNTSHLSSAWPTVLVVNAQVPATEHVALTALVNDSRIQAYLRNGLSVVQQDTVHSQLHEPKFVLELAARAVMPEHVCSLLRLLTPVVTIPACQHR